MASESYSNAPGCLGLLAAGFILFGIVALNEGDSEGGISMLLVGGIFGYVCWKQSSRPPESADSKTKESGDLGPHKLEVGVALERKILQGVPLTLAVFKVRGIFSQNRDLFKPRFQLRISDVTNGVPSDSPRVLTVIDDQQEPGSTEFRLQVDLPKPVPAGGGAREWVNIGATPVEALIFPTRGQRAFQVMLTIFDHAGNRPVSSATCLWRRTVESGYLEHEAQEADAQASSAKLAMVMAAADGTVDDTEVEVIKAWGEKCVGSLGGRRQSERRDRLNQALREASHLIRENQIATLEEDAIQVLRGLGEIRFMYEAYELCLQVLKADGEAHPEEMGRLTGLARRLDLDETKVRVLTDRHLSEIEFTAMGGDAADDQILGLSAEMSQADIRKHLNKLYKKYQARSTHDDPKVSAKAKEWLDRIAAARVRHLS